MVEMCREEGEEEEKHGQNGKTSERFGTQLSFDMCFAVKSLKKLIESKNCISKCMGRIQQSLYTGYYCTLYVYIMYRF